MIAEIEWPFLIFAALIALFVFTWGPFKRLIREINLSWASGDMERSLDAALKLRRSWLPPALLTRIANPGHQELLIALRYRSLSQPDKALSWCQKGLRIARKPVTKGTLHTISATTHAQRNESEQVEKHLTALKSDPRIAAQNELPVFCVAAFCFFQMGKLDKALITIKEGLAEIEGPLPILLLNNILTTFTCLGRFDEALQLAQWITSVAHKQKNLVGRHDIMERGLGQDKFRQAYAKLLETYNLSAMLSAAKAADRWDLFEQYLQVLQERGTDSIGAEIHLLENQALWAAHCGDRNLLITLLDDMHQQFNEGCPNNDSIRLSMCQFSGEAWQLVGEHERALDELALATTLEAPPIVQSELAWLSACSLEALGRTDEARAKREQAIGSAPPAYWNDTGPCSEEMDHAVNEIFTAVTENTSQPGQPRVGIEGISPVEPVVSSPASAAWILAIPAMIPVIGSLAGIALLVLSILLLKKRKPLLYDRRVGWAALVISLLSIGFAAAAVVNYVSIGFEDAALQSSNAYQETWPEDELSEMDIELGSYEEAADTDDSSYDTEFSWPQVIIIFAVLFISIIFHEIGHGMAAFWSGDPTARQQGRFSLNPLRHIDPVGSIVVPVVLALLPGSVVIIGWAKPVPIKPHRFRRYRWGLAGVTLAGVSMNLLLALLATNILGMILMAIKLIYPNAQIEDVMCQSAHLTMSDVAYPFIWSGVIEICKTAILINSLLAGFNLLPFPPLDGFGLLRAVAPAGLAPVLSKMTGIGMIVLLCLIAFNWLVLLLYPAIILAVVLWEVATLLAGGV